MKFKLKTSQINALFAIFSNSMSDYETTAFNNDGVEVKARKQFDLGSLRFTLACNANRLKPIVDAYNTSRSAMIKELAPSGTLNTKTEPAKAAQFADAMKVVLDEEHDVILVPLKQEQLKLDSNPFAVDVLMVLNETGLLIPTKEKDEP